MAKHQLPSGRDASHLRKISDEFFAKYDEPIAELARRPKVGGGRGIAPSSIGDRLAEAFGSKHNRYPFMPTEKLLNIAKGKVMMHQAPVGVDKIKKALERALVEDSWEAADNLLSEIRMVYTIFEYMQQRGFHARFSNVHQEMFTQLYFSENALKQDGLQDWWDSWSDDHNRFAEAKAKSWLTEQLNRVADGYIEAMNSGRHMQTFDTVMQQVEEWRDDMDARLFIPKPASLRFRNQDNGEGPSNS